jgi:hypothetical protein
MGRRRAWIVLGARGRAFPGGPLAHLEVREHTPATRVVFRHTERHGYSR